MVLWKGNIGANYSSKRIGCYSFNIDLSGAEIELSSEPGREYILKELIENIRVLDYIIIDSPSLGL
jgi:chromosome partitioning protein